MQTALLRIAPVVLLLCLSLQACKKHAPVNQPVPGVAERSPATQASAPEPVAGTAPAAAAPAAPFDFNTIAEAAGPIPPFPYVRLPPGIPEVSKGTIVYPMDEVDVMLGSHLHRLEGRVMMRTFAHDNARMSALEVRRNYLHALKAFGAVKVNTDQPGVHYFGDDRMKKLRPLSYDMSYDVYLARKGAVRNWLVVMTDDRDTRLLSIEELPFVQTIGYEGSPVTATGVPPVAAQPLDIGATPVTTAPLPPFPFLAFPEALRESERGVKRANFDAVSFIAGNQLRSVEGKVAVHSFENSDAKMSAMALRRNYAAAVKGLGAVKVNAIEPKDKALMAANGGEVAMNAKLRFRSSKLTQT